MGATIPVPSAVKWWRIRRSAQFLNKNYYDGALLLQCLLENAVDDAKGGRPAASERGLVSDNRFESEGRRAQTSYAC